MLADKEAKQITYKLLEENFIQMQELRKPSTGFAGAGVPNKSFILFYVDLHAVCFYPRRNYKVYRRLRWQKMLSLRSVGNTLEVIGT